MKNLILITITTFVFAITVSAQNSSFGFKGAYHLSSMAVDKNQIDENKIKPGFSAGFVNQNRKGFMIYQTELLWSRKGAKYSLLNNTAKVNANLDYLELPANIGINLFDTPLNIYAGPYTAYLLRADYEYLDANENVIANYNNKEAFKNWDFGFQTGLQFQLKRLLLDARFSRGLTNVEDEDVQVSNPTFLPNKTKNYNLQFSVGLLF